MNYIIAFLFYIYSSASIAGGNIPMLFTPQTLPGVDIRWNVVSFQFDGYGAPGYPNTFTLTNYGDKLSNFLTISLNGGDPSYTITTDNCTGIKLAVSHSCTVEVHYNGPNSLLPLQYLHAEDTDGKTTPSDVTIKNCNGC
jgi:hypothetical protein